MGNIEFSKIGRAILKNRVLANYISRRLANVTPQEDAAGQIVIELEDGNKLILRFGPGRQVSTHEGQLQTA